MYVHLRCCLGCAVTHQKKSPRAVDFETVLAPSMQCLTVRASQSKPYSIKIVSYRGLGGGELPWCRVYWTNRQTLLSNYHNYLLMILLFNIIFIIILTSRYYEIVLTLVYERYLKLSVIADDFMSRHY